MVKYINFFGYFNMTNRPNSYGEILLTLGYVIVLLLVHCSRLSPISRCGLLLFPFILLTGLVSPATCKRSGKLMLISTKLKRFSFIFIFEKHSDSLCTVLNREQALLILEHSEGCIKEDNLFLQTTFVRCLWYYV